MINYEIKPNLPIKRIGKIVTDDNNREQLIFHVTHRLPFDSINIHGRITKNDWYIVMMDKYDFPLWAYHYLVGWKKNSSIRMRKIQIYQRAVAPESEYTITTRAHLNDLITGQ